MHRKHIALCSRFLVFFGIQSKARWEKKDVSFVLGLGWVFFLFSARLFFNFIKMSRLLVCARLLNGVIYCTSCCRAKIHLPAELRKLYPCRPLIQFSALLCFVHIEYAPYRCGRNARVARRLIVISPVVLDSGVHLALYATRVELLRKMPLGKLGVLLSDVRSVTEQVPNGFQPP